MRLYSSIILCTIAIMHLALLGAITGTNATSHSNVGQIQITKNWLRATPPAAKAGGGFMTISNEGANADILTAVHFESARKSEIHEMKVDNGVMTMRQLDDGVIIPAGGQVVLEPGGFHLMLMGLKNQLKDGETYSLKLKFKNAGEMFVDFPVLSMRAGKLLMEGN